MLTWLLIMITVLLGSAGDVLCAKGMARGGAITSFHPSGLRALIRSIVVRRLVILGWICDAISFFSLLALLSVAQLSIAVPATALSFVIDTVGARFFLHEHVHWKRWVGVLLVTMGVVLTVRSGNDNVATGTRGPSPAAVKAHLLTGTRGPTSSAVKPHHHQAGNHK